MTLAQIGAALRSAGIGEWRAEALILAEHFTGLSRAHLLTCGDAELEDKGLDAAVRRRMQREPLTYITGVAYFMNEEYEVGPECLVPRRETECLVEAAAGMLAGHASPRVFDVCTGSGCVAVSLALLVPDARVLGTDISSGALSIAARNAARNRAADRVRFEPADMFTWSTGEQFDLIVSNPPYIRADEMAALDPELSFEPEIALTDGGDGLSFVRELCSRYADFLRPGGSLLCEIGSAQGKAALGIARDHGLEARILPDYSGLDRILAARRSGA